LTFERHRADFSRRFQIFDGDADIIRRFVQ
jgi:hypothetical protein